MRRTLTALIALAAACAPADDRSPSSGALAMAGEPGAGSAEAEEALRLTLERAHTLADSIEDILRPVPLMRPAEENALRQYGQSSQLPRARALGVRPADDAEMDAHARAGRLVTLEDSTAFWTLRNLRASRALVTPDTRRLLEEIGTRFQDRLDDMGIPPYRIEVTSALRSAADQARLRRTNVNAAAGVSTHEFGTTVDIAYTAFAPPAELPAGIVAEGPDWIAPYLEAVARPILESVSARKSRELQKILGDILRELQGEGMVLVTLERLQPVYHITVGRRLVEAPDG